MIMTVSISLISMLHSFIHFTDHPLCSGLCYSWEETEQNRAGEWQAQGVIGAQGVPEPQKGTISFAQGKCVIR